MEAVPVYGYDNQAIEYKKTKFLKETWASLIHFHE
jgi:hypothetical protein